MAQSLNLSSPAGVTAAIAADFCDGEENLAFSGFGLWAAMSLLASAAQGDSARAAAQFAGCSGIDAAEALEAALMRANKSVSVRQALVARASEKFDDRFLGWLPSVGFGPLAAPDALNQWVAQVTQGAIDEAPLVADEDARLAVSHVISAVARWQRPFNPAFTREEEFHTAAGPVMVPMMRRTFGAGSCANIGGAAVLSVALESPSDSSATASVRFVLGPENANPAAVLRAAMADVSGAELWSATDNLHVVLPRFVLSSVLDLGPVVRHYGGEVLFGDEADLSRTGCEMRLSDVRQKSVVYVMERSDSEAAEHEGGSESVFMTDEEETELRFDRPFGFVFRSSDGVPLVAGWVADPS